MNASALSVKRKYSSMLEEYPKDQPRFKSEMMMQSKGPKIKSKAFNIPILDNKFLASLCQQSGMSQAIKPAGYIQIEESNYPSSNRASKH